MPSYDSAYRRASVRRGREQGCWFYLPAEELAKTGHPPAAPPPRYRLWAAPRGHIVVQLYRDK